MGSSKRERQKAGRQARIEQAQRLDRRAAMRRRTFLKTAKRNCDVKPGDTRAVFDSVELPTGKNGFQVTFTVNGREVFGGRDQDGDSQGPIHVTFERLK